MLRLHDGRSSYATGPVIQDPLHRQVPPAIGCPRVHKPLHVLVLGVAAEKIEEESLKSVVIEDVPLECERGDPSELSRSGLPEIDR